MPELQPPEVDEFVSILRLRAQWEQSPQGAGESAWHFAQINSPFEPLQEQLWELWRDNLKDAWQARRPQGWIFQRVLIEDIWPGVREPLEIDLNEAADPLNPGGAPVQISPIITWGTQYRGRSYRGRTYWGQIALPDLAFSTISNDLYINMADFASAMASTFYATGPLDTDPKLCVFSRQHNLVPELLGRYAMVNFHVLRSTPGIIRQRRFGSAP